MNGNIASTERRVTMNNLTNITTYSDYKQALRTELNTAAVSFVRIGYLLKQAKYTDILAESEYENLDEFAKKEFGLEKSQVSRFININNRFSVDGNSPELKEEYKNFGVAKLSIMLTLPDKINENLSPEMPKSMISDVQKEVKEEQEIGGTELLLEGTDPGQEQYTSVITKCIYEYYHSNPNEYVKIYNTDEWHKEKIMHIFCPLGVMAQMVRLQGIGRYMISVKDYEHNITFTNVRDNTQEECSWEYLIDVIFQICMCAESVVGMELKAEQAWEKIYNEEYPKPEPEPESEKKEEPKQKKTQNDNEKKYEKDSEKNNNVDDIPEVEAEIVDIERETPTAHTETIKREVEDKNTTEENEEVAPVQQYRNEKSQENKQQKKTYVIKIEIEQTEKLNDEELLQIKHDLQEEISKKIKDAKNISITIEEV